MPLAGLTDPFHKIQVRHDYENDVWYFLHPGLVEIQKAKTTHCFWFKINGSSDDENNYMYNPINKTNNDVNVFFPAIYFIYVWHLWLFCHQVTTRNRNRNKKHNKGRKWKANTIPFRIAQSPWRGFIWKGKWNATTDFVPVFIWLEMVFCKRFFLFAK